MSPRDLNSMFITATCALAALTFCILSPAKVAAQWTTPDANQNINNTNSNNVGVGTTVPLYKLEVANSVDKAQIRFGLGALDSGGFLFSNAPSHAVFSGGASWNGGWIAKTMSASLFQANNGAITIFGNTGLTPGNSRTTGSGLRFCDSFYSHDDTRRAYSSSPAPKNRSPHRTIPNNSDAGFQTFAVSFSYSNSFGFRIIRPKPSQNQRSKTSVPLSCWHVYCPSIVSKLVFRANTGGNCGE